MQGTAPTASETPSGPADTATSADATSGGLAHSPDASPAPAPDAQPSNVVDIDKAKQPKKKAPLNREKLRKEALEAQIKRRVQKLKKGMSIAELEALIAKLDADEAAKNPAQEVSTEASAAAPTEPAAPADAPSAAASDDKLDGAELHTALAQLIVGTAAGALQGTRYSLEGYVAFPVLTKTGVRLEATPKVELLIQKAIPVIAERMANKKLSPTQDLFLTLAMIWAAPAASHVAEAAPELVGAVRNMFQPKASAA